MKEFYQSLKQKREELGLTLMDIHRRTRLPLKYLEAIEEGKIEVIPRGYERIYLRRYVKEIGLDEEEVLRDFDILTGRLTVLSEEGVKAEPTPKKKTSQKKKPSQSPAKAKDGENKLPPGKRKKDQPQISSSQKIRQIRESMLSQLNLDQLHRYFWISVAVILVAIVGYFSYQQFKFEKSNTIQVKEISLTELIEEMQRQDSTLTRTMKQNTAVTVEGNANFQVLLKAVKRTWVKEIRDVKDTTDYILTPGFERRIEAKDRVKFMLGRADGVEIYLNGQNLGIMGAADEIVLSLVISRKGILEKRVRKVKPKPEVPSDTVQAATVSNEL